MTEEPIFLTNLWYMAALSSSLKPGAMRREMLCGEPVMLARGPDGRAFALRDICPHRAAPLSAGRFKDGDVECPYHGWRFKPDGQCAHIPSLLQDQDMDVGRIRVQNYPAREQDGLIWVYFAADPKSDAPPILDPPVIPIGPADGHAIPRFVEAQMFPLRGRSCGGRTDGPGARALRPPRLVVAERSLHPRQGEASRALDRAASPWSATSPRPIPSCTKFSAAICRPKSASSCRALRFEHIRAGKREVLGFTAVTPKDAHTTLVTQVFYWTMPWLAAIKPFFRPFARAFLGQDRRIVELQNEGLKFAPPQMLIQDADVPAIWYHRLKKAWAESVETGKPFVNPVQERTLRWRS